MSQEMSLLDLLHKFPDDASAEAWFTEQRWGEPLCSTTHDPRSPVYPRVCGGTSLEANVVAVALGLSPRVRGNRRRCPPGLLLSRSIPACTGEPSQSALETAAYPVYPRVYGGTTQWPTPSGLCIGLSPRVRGNPNADMTEPYQWGSIPACAGEPPSQPASRTWQPVYPRVCGGTTVGVIGG